MGSNHNNYHNNLFQNLKFNIQQKPKLPNGCGWHPRKVRTAKYLASAALEMRDKNILELALLVPFFGDFFGQAKKLQKVS